MPTSVIASTIEALDDAHRHRAQWICWRKEERDGTPTKVPIQPAQTGTAEAVYASHSDPATWREFETALAYHRDADGRTAGIGYVFTADGPLVGIDLDACRDPRTGDLEDWARDIIAQLDSYTEVSPSGTGVHVLVRGELPPEGGRRHGDVEMYDNKRFFTVTGTHLDQTPLAIRARQDALETVHEEHIQSPAQTTTASNLLEDSWVDDLPEGVTVPDDAIPGGSDPATTDAATAQRQVADLTDTELVERAKAADDNGKFAALWAGHWQRTAAPSQSEADMMLACKLAFWTAGDPQRMDRLFRQSGLMRDKWDEVHYANGDTYGEQCLTRAVNQVSDFYTPHGPETDDPDETDAAASTAATEARSAAAPEPSDLLERASVNRDTSAQEHTAATSSRETTAAVPSDGGRPDETAEKQSPADTATRSPTTAADAETESEPDREAMRAEKDARIEELETKLERRQRKIMTLQEKVKELRSQLRAAEADGEREGDTEATAAKAQKTDGAVSWLRDRLS